MRVRRAETPQSFLRTVMGMLAWFPSQAAASSGAAFRKTSRPPPRFSLNKAPGAICCCSKCRKHQITLEVLEFIGLHAGKLEDNVHFFLMEVAGTCRWTDEKHQNVPCASRQAPMSKSRLLIY